MAEKLKGYRYSVVVERGKDPEPIHMKFHDGVLFPQMHGSLPGPVKLQYFDKVSPVQIQELEAGSIIAEKPDGTKFLATGELVPPVKDYPYDLEGIEQQLKVHDTFTEYLRGTDWELIDRRDELEVIASAGSNYFTSTIVEMSGKQCVETVNGILSVLREGQSSIKSENALLLLGFFMKNSPEASAMRAVRGVTELMKEKGRDMELRTRSIGSLSKAARAGEEKVATKATKGLISLAKDMDQEPKIRSAGLDALGVIGTEADEKVALEAVKGLDSLTKNKEQNPSVKSRGINNLIEISKGSSEAVAIAAVQSLSSFAKSRRQGFEMRIYALMSLSDIAQNTKENVAIEAVRGMSVASKDSRGEINDAARDKLRHISGAGLGGISSEARRALD